MTGFEKEATILGCGWLGLPLAQSLIQNGWKVRGSTTREEKMDTLKKKGIKAYHLSLDPNPTGERWEEFLDSPHLVLNIPPKVRSQGPSFHKEQIDSLLPLLPSEIKVLFVSSTSVYGDDQGKVTEESPRRATKTSGQVLCEVENRLREKLKERLTIVRPGGLVGPDRNPARFLSGKKNLRGGNRSVNLIHKEDIVAICKKILTQQVWGEVFNAVSDEHLSKKEFYSKVCRAQGLTPPLYEESREEEKGKIISNEKVKEKLGIEFQYPELVRSFL